MGSGAVEDVVDEAACVVSAPAAAIYLERPPPRPATQLAVAEDFRNSRRDARRICTPPRQGFPRNLARVPLGQFIQVDLRIPYLGRLHKFVPGDLVSLVCGAASHHTGKSRFGALGRLVMQIAAADAFNEGLLLFAIGELQIGRKASRDRERTGLRFIFFGETACLPRFIAPDAEWA